MASYSSQVPTAQHCRQLSWRANSYGCWGFLTSVPQDPCETLTFSTVVLEVFVEVQLAVRQDAETFNGVQQLRLNIRNI
jgi:hypothetical protein